MSCMYIDVRWFILRDYSALQCRRTQTLAYELHARGVATVPRNLHRKMVDARQFLRLNVAAIDELHDTISACVVMHFVRFGKRC